MATYLDHNATTRLNPAAHAAMCPWLDGRCWGHPASPHHFGRSAKAAVETAREQVAQALGAQPDEVIFTSGATESIGIVFLAAALSAFAPDRRIVACSAGEHPAVMAGVRRLEQHWGWSSMMCGLDREGLGRDADIEAALQRKPGLISWIMAHNETGVIHDVSALAQRAQQVRGDMGGTLCFHVDAVQAFGKMPINFSQLRSNGVGALSVSAHKIGGPQGVGALVMDTRMDAQPLLAASQQERAMRPGTLPVAAIVGFGVAAQEAAAHQARSSAAVLALRQELESRLAGQGAIIFGSRSPRLPNTTFFAMPGIDGATLVSALDRAGYAVSSGSACSSDRQEIAPVLAAMGIEPALARAAVRVSLSAHNTLSEIEGFLIALTAQANRLRSLSACAA
jgi:cysteine desulfurase